MADAYRTVAQMAVINDGNLAGIEVSSLFDDAPMLRRLPAVTASHGHLHKYLDYTAAPAVGFRAENDGLENVVSTDTLRTITCTIADASFAVDLAVANTWQGGAEAYITREAVRHLRQAMFVVETQIFNGTTDGDSAGFTGLANKHDALADAHVLGQGGTTACSSVYLLRVDPDDIAIVVGNNGVIDIGETVVQRTAGTTGWYPTYWTPITAWYALQYGGFAAATSSVRLANFDAGSNTVTDDAIFAGWELFPASRKPNVCCMGRRSAEQLRASRTATNATGAPAEVPTGVAGMEVIITDGIGVAETAVA